MALWPKILKCVSFRCCRWSEHVALHHPETRILDSETPNDCKGKKKMDAPLHHDPPKLDHLSATLHQRSQHQWCPCPSTRWSETSVPERPRVSWRKWIAKGIQQKIHSKLEIHPTIEVSWWKKKMVDDFDDYWNYCWMNYGWFWLFNSIFGVVVVVLHWQARVPRRWRMCWYWQYWHHQPVN